MNAWTPRSSNASPEAARLQLERSIDQLAELARQGVEPGHFFRELLGRATEIGGATRAILWRLSAEGTWQPAGGLPTSTSIAADTMTQRQAELSELAEAAQPRRVVKGPAEVLRLGLIVYAGQTVGVLETAHPPTNGDALSTDTEQFLSALSEVTGDFLAQRELQQLRAARATWQQWDQYGQQLWQSLELPQVAATIANDGRLLLDADRVSVLVQRGRALRLQAVSGVERIEPRSTATRSLERLAAEVAATGQAVWHQTTASKTEDRLAEVIAQHVRDTGATAVGIVPIFPTAVSSSKQRTAAVIVVEQFRSMSEGTDWSTRGAALAQRSAGPLVAAWERSQTLGGGLRRRLGQWFTQPTTGLGLLLLAIIIAALTLIPAKFTVTGPAELWPAQRREIFASTSGVIDQILVAHADEVQIDQPLLVLRDPVLEADTPRLTGELATIKERLKGLQAARLAGGSTADAAVRARQLTADEAELKERQRTLELQHSLLEERRKALTLRSPIAGTVLTWDVDQQLSARPVERGQPLLSVGHTAGPWVVEVLVPDRSIGHLLRAQRATRPDLPVEFLLTADPDRVIHGTIQSVAQTAEAQDALGSHVRVIVAFDREQIAQLRPGATAVPRIACGQRSLGYVWLHDLIDLIRTRILF